MLMAPAPHPPSPLTNSKSMIALWTLQSSTCIHAVWPYPHLSPPSHPSTPSLFMPPYHSPWLTLFILLSVQYVPAPNITFDDGRHVNLTIEGSFYDQFILPSVCTIYQQINGDSPTMRPCTKYPFTHVFLFFVFFNIFFIWTCLFSLSLCNTLNVNVSITANITWWVSRTYSSGVYNSSFLVRQAGFLNGISSLSSPVTPRHLP